MRRTVALALALTAAGCSGVEDKPSTSRLQAGQVVIMAPRSPTGALSIDPPNGILFRPGTPAGKLPTLLAGDTARVITDESAEIGFNRKVRCIVLESSPKHPAGDFAETECLITRGEIRPIAKQE